MRISPTASITRLGSFSHLVCLFLLFNFLTPPPGALALFEDQVGKFDWRGLNVGIPKAAKFWETSKDAAIITRNDNVLAALDADSGSLRWRHVMEFGEEIRDILLQDDRRVTSLSWNNQEGIEQIALRTWSPLNGALTSETVFQAETWPDQGFLVGDEAYLINMDDKGGIKAKVYDVQRGTETLTATFSTGAGEKVECANTQETFVCLAKTAKSIYYAPLPMESPKGAFNLVPLEQLNLPDNVKPSDIYSVPGTSNTIGITLKNTDDRSEEIMLVRFEDGKMKGSNVLKNKKASSIKLVTGCKNTDDLLTLEQACSGSQCTQFEQSVAISKWKSSLKKSIHEVEHKFSKPRGRVVQAWATCAQDEAGEISYQIVILNQDGSMTSLSPNANEFWSREEDLANIKKVELVPSPAIDEEGSDAAPNPADATDVMGQFLRRIKRHLALLNAAFTRLLELKQQLAASSAFILGSSDTSMDDFGIRKVIVAVTSNGNVFGIDSKNGQVLWKLFFPSMSQDKHSICSLHVQRSSGHFGLDPQLALVFTNRQTGHAELIHFNPHTGKVLEAKSVGKSLSQVILLHQDDEHFIRPLLLFENGVDNVQIEPPSAVKHISPISKKTFVVTHDKETGLIKGQRLSKTSGGENFKLTPVWTLSNPDLDIQTIVAKSSDEIVHSQGRVMADRSVLFKYINPNLGFVLGEGINAAGKPFINVYLIDLVNGKILFSANHKRVHGPYHVVHSENWAVYSYYNEKARRGEVTSLELFEGNTQSNTSVFSSLTNNVSPLVERQAFILGPSHVSAICDTITGKGITSKNLLLATQAGALYNIPRHILDPRRPNINTPPEMREPGLPPYIPELTLPPETVLNYNQSIGLPRGIATAATGLESTSVAFVWGLDIYCTRVTPSKGFDLLKEDFDHFVIAAVLVALVGAAYLTKRLSVRKSLKQAWR